MHGYAWIVVMGLVLELVGFDRYQQKGSLAEEGKGWKGSKGGWRRDPCVHHCDKLPSTTAKRSYPTSLRSDWYGTNSTDEKKIQQIEQSHHDALSKLP